MYGWKEIVLPTISDEYPKQKNSQPSNLLVNANEFFAAMDLFAKFYPTWNQLVVVNLTKTKIKIQKDPWNFFESVDMLNPKTRWQNLQKSNEARDSSVQIILKRRFVLNLTHQGQKSKSLLINSLKVSKCSMREQNIEGGRQNLRQLNCSFTTISSQFFGIYMNIFQKTEVQTVILRCWTFLYLNWFYSYGIKG